MKKIVTVLSIASFVFACSPKVAPTANPGTSSTSTSTTTTTTTTSTTTTPVSDVNETAIAAGHTIYTTKCTKCHGDKGVGNYTATRWEGILKAMAPKAKLTETETAQVAAYVKANAKVGQP